MIDFDQVKRIVDGHSLIKSVDRIQKGHLRLETGFLYPDGSSIDLFIVEDSRAPLLPPKKLSDLGQTMSWLLDLQVRPWASKKRKRFIEDALRIYGVAQEGGELVHPLSDFGDLIGSIVKLGQACVRVADLTYTRRSSLQVVFNEEFEEVLLDLEVPYAQNFELVGKFGKPVRVDYLVTGASTQSAVLTLYSGSTSYAHIQANEVFSRWYDLDSPIRNEQKVTVFDDRLDVFKDEDLRRIREYSDLVGFTDRQTLSDLVAA